MNRGAKLRRTAPSRSRGIQSVQDLLGRSVVVTARTLANTGYSNFAIVLKHAGVDPAQVNWVVQPDANPVALFLAGRNDAIRVATVGAAALRSNPANSGHVIHNQLMDRPWSLLPCCMLVARQEWYRAKPIAAKRAVWAVLRSADAQTTSRVDAVKRMTDRASSAARPTSTTPFTPRAWCQRTGAILTWSGASGSTASC